MIEKFRKVAKNPIMKIIMLILVVSFMLSGISAGVMSQATDDHIVKVAGEKIYPVHVQNEIRKIQNSILERNPSIELDDNLLASLGVTPQRVLNDMMEQRLLFAEVDDLGLTVSDDLLRREITNSPTFQTEGKFNRDTFQRFLYTQSLREHQYLDQLRNELSANLLLTSLFGSVGLPQNIYDLGKKEVAGLYTIEFASIPRGYGEIGAEPTDEELQQYIFVNSQIFERPEGRIVSLITVPKLADAAKSLEMAEAIEDEIAGGATLAEIAVKQNSKVEEKEYTATYSNDDANVRAYEIDEGEITVIEGEENFTVLQLDQIRAAYVPELADMRDFVEKEWRENAQSEATKNAARALYAVAKESNELPAGLKRTTSAKISAQDFPVNTPYQRMEGGNLIEAKEGSVFGVYRALSAPNGYAIAKLIKKEYAAPSAEELESLKNGASQNYVAELRSAYISHLADKHGVEMHEIDEPEISVEVE